MGYFVVEATDGQPQRKNAVARFDSAYGAVDYIVAAWYARKPQAAHYYLVDSDGCVLLEPYDLIGKGALGAEMEGRGGRDGG